MTNLIKTVNSYIKDNIENIVIYNDLFPKSDIEGVISIHDPASRKTADFIDGSAEFQTNISYTARFKDAKKSRKILTNILDLLDGAKLADTTDRIKIKLSAVSNVQFVGADDKNASIYTCSLNAIYTKTGD